MTIVIEVLAALSLLWAGHLHPAWQTNPILKHPAGRIGIAVLVIAAILGWHYYENESDEWETVKKVDIPEGYCTYLKDYPQGRFVSQARLVCPSTRPVEDAAAPAADATAPAADAVAPPASDDSVPAADAAAPAADAAAPAADSIMQTRTQLESQMVAISGGGFLMGSPETEPERNSNEKQHSVHVDDFQMGKYEVTQAQWQAVMGNNPSNFKGDDLPVENVSWDDAQLFINRLNKEIADDKPKFRLPTEVQWEYAARGGTTTPFWTGGCIKTTQANFNSAYEYNGCGAKTNDSVGKTVAVNSYKPNAWGLYNMAGNVWEWTCSDYVEDYNGSEKCTSNNDAKTLRVVRGGSWGDTPGWLRSAYRNYFPPDVRIYFIGLRLSRM